MVFGLQRTLCEMQTKTQWEWPRSLSNHFNIFIGVRYIYGKKNLCFHARANAERKKLIASVLQQTEAQLEC